MTKGLYVTLCHTKMHQHTKCGIPTSNNMKCASDTIIIKTRPEVTVSDPKLVLDTLPYQEASTHQISDSYLKEHKRYASDTKRDGGRASKN